MGDESTRRPPPSKNARRTSPRARALRESAPTSNGEPGAQADRRDALAAWRERRACAARCGRASSAGARRQCACQRTRAPRRSMQSSRRRMNRFRLRRDGLCPAARHARSCLASSRASPSSCPSPRPATSSSSPDLLGAQRREGQGLRHRDPAGRDPRRVLGIPRALREGVLGHRRRDRVQQRFAAEPLRRVPARRDRRASRSSRRSRRTSSNPVSVAIALIVGAVAIFAIERWYERHGAPRVTRVDEMTLEGRAEGRARAVPLAHPRHVALGRHDHGRHGVRPVAPGGDRVLVLPRGADHVRRERLPVREVPRRSSRRRTSRRSRSASW